MSTRLSWSPAQKTLAEQAEESINCIRRLNYECDFSFPTGKEIFDKCTLPVITYHTINRAAFVCLSVCLFPYSSEVL